MSDELIWSIYRQMHCVEINSKVHQPHGTCLNQAYAIHLRVKPRGILAAFSVEDLDRECQNQVQTHLGRGCNGKKSVSLVQIGRRHTTIADVTVDQPPTVWRIFIRFLYYLRNIFIAYRRKVY
jgi:hypothetical protein